MLTAAPADITAHDELVWAWIDGKVDALPPGVDPHLDAPLGDAPPLTAPPASDCL